MRRKVKGSDTEPKPHRPKQIAFPDAAERFLQARKDLGEKGETVETFSKHAGISAGMISSIETKKNNPSMGTLKKWSEKTGKSPAWLLGVAAESISQIDERSKYQRVAKELRHKYGQDWMDWLASLADRGEIEAAKRGARKEVLWYREEHGIQATTSESPESASVHPIRSSE